MDSVIATPHLGNGRFGRVMVGQIGDGRTYGRTKKGGMVGRMVGRTYVRFYYLYSNLTLREL